MKKVIAVLAVVSAGLMLVVAAVQADTKSENFEGFALGSPNGQAGWVFTGPYDVEVVDPDGFAVMGDRALRISNADTSGSFGDWVFSPSLIDRAGETSSAANGFADGALNPYFEASFDIASAVPAAEQPGLQISVSPDRGDGARMSYLRFADTPDGIDVVFTDYVDMAPAGGCNGADDFATRTVTTVSRGAVHHVRLTMQFIDGRSNDVVKVYVDGALVVSGGSWEDFFRDCQGSPTRPVDSLLFQARDNAGEAPGTLGNGFFVDNVSLTSGATPVTPTPTPTTTTTTTTTAPPPTAGSCTISGTAGADTLLGTPNADVICAKAGDDVVRGLAGADILKGGPGNDLLRGGAGDDLLNGGRGYDTCRGGKGTDTLRKCEA